MEKQTYFKICFIHNSFLYTLQKYYIGETQEK